MNKPAVIDGIPIFDQKIPILRPFLPKFSEINNMLEEVFESKQITNGKYVREFEKKTAEYLKVDHCVAVSSCTAGLMLVAMGLNLTGEVIIPSFTFSATGHAMVWKGLKPVFVDCLRDTFNIDPDQIEINITQRTSAILAVHIFGNPANVNALDAIAKKHNLHLIFDAAHAFGSTYQGKKIGASGDAEVFSLSPTKLLITGEGGLVATNNEELAQEIRTGRSYGDPGNYNCTSTGLNARMAESNAILGLSSLNLLEANIERRNHIAKLLIKGFESLPGISFQKIEFGDTTTWKDFSIIIDKNKFGINRDLLALSLEMEGIDTRKYFFPSLHKMTVYEEVFKESFSELTVTDYISNNILSLPIYYDLHDDDVEKIIHAIASIHAHAEKVKARLKGYSNGEYNT